MIWRWDVRAHDAQPTIELSLFSSLPGALPLSKTSVKLFFTPMVFPSPKFFSILLDRNDLALILRVSRSPHRFGLVCSSF